MSKDSFEEFLHQDFGENDSIILSHLKNLQYGFKTLNNEIVMYDFGWDSKDDSLRYSFMNGDNFNSFDTLKGDIIVLYVSKEDCRSYQNSLRTDIKIFSNDSLKYDSRLIIEVSYGLLAKFITYSFSLSSEENPRLSYSDREISNLICSIDNNIWYCNYDNNSLNTHYNYFEQLVISYLDTSSIVKDMKIDSIRIPILHW